MTPVFAHGRLRLWLLELLDESPKHGYELIRRMEQRFLGMYTPSAGTIYPRLSRLETEGLVTHHEEGGRKVYSLTRAGREEVRRRRDDLEALDAEILDSVRSMAQELGGEVRDTLRDVREEVGRAARDVLGGGQDHRAGTRWDSFLSTLAARAAREARARRPPVGPPAGEPAVTDPAVTEPAGREPADQPPAARETALPERPAAERAGAEAGGAADPLAVPLPYPPGGAAGARGARSDPVALFDRRLQEFRDRARDIVHESAARTPVEAAQLRECVVILSEALAGIRRVLDPPAGDP